MTALSSRWAWFGCALFTLTACRAPFVAEDPYRDALHVERIGHATPFSRNTEAGKTTTAPAASFAEEVAHIDRLLERWWIHAPSPRPPFRPFDGAPPDDRAAYAKGLQKALCDLGDLDLRLKAGAKATRIESGVRATWAGAELVIAAVDPRYDSEERGPKVGDVVERIDGEPPTAWAGAGCLPTAAAHRAHLVAARIERQSVPESEQAQPHKLTLRDTRGKTRELELQWKKVNASDPRCVESDARDPDLGRLIVTDFDCAGIDGRPSPTKFIEQLTAALGALAEKPQVLVDLRHAGGADLEGARHLAQRLVPRTEVWMRHRVQDPGHPKAVFVDEPLPVSETPPLPSRLWVALGPGCSGACEVVAAFLTQDAGITSLGGATAGLAARTKTFKLPFSQFELEIPNETFAIPDSDTSLHARGVTPTVEIVTSAEDVRQGRDPVLESLRQRIRTQGAASH